MKQCKSYTRVKHASPSPVLPTELYVVTELKIEFSGVTAPDSITLGQTVRA